MNKHRAILPDGSIATRNSKDRVYPFCVAFRLDYLHALAEAERPRQIYADNYRYYAEVAADPNHRHRDYQTDKERQILQDYPDGEAYMMAMRDEAVERVELLKDQGHYGRWGVAGWNGRRDLAERMLQKEAASPWNAEARIVKTNFA